MTLAVDMDMHRCLPTLHKTQMGAGKMGEELEQDRPLVVGARIWLAASPSLYYSFICGGSRLSRITSSTRKGELKL